MTDFCTYGEFGLAFFQRAVTAERISGGVSGLVGQPVEFGPIGAGPGRIATVSAAGEVGSPTVTRVSAGEPLRFLLRVPVDLRLTVSLPATVNRFRAEMMIELTLTARAAEPLRVVIDIQPPTRDDITVDLRADGMRATVLRLVAGIDGEIRRFVARYVDKEIGKPAVQRARDIDLGAIIDRSSHT
ncbi:MAG: hypothetical protein ACRDSE_10380 [Pseudonocardiaceae bacterium]